MRVLRFSTRLLPLLALLCDARPARAQGSPLTPGTAPVLLAVPLRIVAGRTFDARLRVDLRGRSGSCSGSSVPLVLGAYAIPVRFDPAQIEFVAATGGSTNPYTSVPTYTNPATANASGVVAVTASQSNPSNPTGLVDVAVLTFRTLASSGSTSLVSEPGPASLSSAFQGCAVGGFAGPVSIPAAGQAADISIGGARFYPLTPCRVFDTRTPAATPALAASSTRKFAVAGVCGIDPAASAVSANVSVTDATAAGELRAFPGDQSLPVASTVSFRAGSIRANNAILGLATDGSGTIAIHNTAASSAQVILDVNGYFR